MLITTKLLKSLARQNVVFVVLMLQICIAFSQNKVIIIDPGHGGKDTGAIGINKLKEKDVVLNIAKKIVKLNRTILNNEFDIYLTRYKDTLISLSDRTRLAKELKADAFVSLHCNASKYRAKGIEVYIKNLDIKPSIELGVSILIESTQNLGFKKRGIKFANFQVLRETVLEFPAVLIEIGFISNIYEADYFLKPTNIEAIALAMLLGITNFLSIE